MIPPSTNPTFALLFPRLLSWLHPALTFFLTIKIVLRRYLENDVRDINLPGAHIDYYEMKDLTAYLRNLLPVVAPSIPSGQRRFKIKVGDWSPFWI